MKSLAVLVAVLGLSAAAAFPEEWSLFFVYPANIRHYIDNGSMKRTPEGTVLVWEKTEVADEARIKWSTEKLNEVDCARRRFRLLQGMKYYETDLRFQKLQPQKEWTYFGPDDLSRARYEAMCGKGSRK